MVTAYGGFLVAQEAAKLIALELFREDQISLGRAAELCRAYGFRSWTVPIDALAVEGGLPTRG